MLKFDFRITEGAVERKLRKYLQRRGFRSQSAKFDYCRMAAAGHERGAQLFKFRVRVADLEDVTHRFYGIIRTEKNDQTCVHLAETVEAQLEVLAEWSRDLLPQERQATTASQWMIFAVVGSVICFTLLNTLLAALPL